MIKNILLVFVGVIIGAVIGVGGTYFLYTKAILPAAIDDLGIAENFNPEEATKNINNMKKADAFIPKSLVDQTYHALFEKIINTANTVAKNNNEKIYPAMQLLKEKSQSGNWDGVIDVIVDAKTTIATNRGLVAQMKQDIYSFQNDNNANTKDTTFREKSEILARSGLQLTTSYESYFTVLSQFLTGKTPTKELATDLNIKIKDLSDKNWDFQQKINDVYTIIDSESAKAQAQGQAEQ